MVSWPPKPKDFMKVLQHYGFLESEVEYKIVCPMHDDINASMLINLKVGKFYCFGCHKAGNAFDFVKYVNEKKSDLYALKKYFKIINNRSKNKEINSIKTKVAKSKVEVKSNKELKQQAWQYFYGLAKTNWYENSEEKQYLKARGFKTNTLKKADVRINCNTSYPIIFPILDNKRFKGWVCRTMDSEIEKKRKYLYNKGFRRANTLSGTYRTKTVVIVEGHIDMIKAKQLGIENVVAILGWKISDKQISKLKEEGIKNVICALDNDECGKKGFAYLQNYFNVIKFIYPKATKDMGSINKKDFGKAKLKVNKKIKRAKEEGKWD